ncbi:MAG: DUF721 domain-containing protein [Gammaproteobacteria bacterium]|nr:DUF721 domain-containing protein [Gammaproteobacteria bacterium]
MDKFSDLLSRQSPGRQGSAAMSVKGTQESERLRQMLKHTRYLRQLERRLQQRLGEQYGGGGGESGVATWRLAHLRQGKLLIETGSSAWGARLRFIQPQLLQLAQQLDKQISTIEIRVRQQRQMAVNGHVVHGPQPLSADSATHLQRLAASLSDDRLRQKLLRIAQFRR